MDLVPGIRNSEIAQKFSRLRFGVPPVHFRKFMFQFRDPQTILFRKIGFRVEVVFFPDDIVKPFVAHDHGRQRRKFVKSKLVLPEKRDALIFSGRHGSGIRLDQSREDFKKRGLPGTVGPDQPVTVAGREHDIHILKKNAFPVL
ncbi:MAG: hypothetical protein BWY44_00683 [Candidatus Omnitrophica bacterium ADurb.Bin292]|nr:MAG: hypothetical protein BWY44_00683 [Candidatus Omnitrophica bacterium ADurb.Bin292]